MAEFNVSGLRVVLEVAERGSFSAAAGRLGYTQSAVSRQIALAESAAGRPLFERHARGVNVTEAGRLLAARAATVLGELEAARQELDGLAVRPAGRLRVGAFSTAMAALVPRAIESFARSAPRVEIVLREGTTSTHLARVGARRLDVAVVTPPDVPPDGVILATLLEDPLLVAVDRRHRLVGEASVAPEELTGERWIVGSPDPDAELLGAWTAAPWDPDIAYVARDWTAKLGLVAAGCGMTVVPGLAAPALPDTISVVRIDHPAASRITAMAFTESSADEPWTRGFAEALRDAAAELAGDLRRRLRV